MNHKTDNRIGTAMRFLFREKGLADPEQMGQIDRVFYGKDKHDLELQIKYYCFKCGIWQAFNMEVKKGEADGAKSETTSKEETPQKSKEKE